MRRNVRQIEDREENNTCNNDTESGKKRDELVRETQASSFTTITATTTEGGAEDLDDLLLSLEAFQEDCRKRLSHLTERKDAMREPGVVTTEEECYTDAVKEEENVESGSEKGDKREEIKEERKTEEEEEEEEEEVRMALESLKEVCNDLSTLGTPQTEGRSVRPKINKSRIKSIDFQLSNQSSSSFGAGQQVEEKPRPRKDSGYSFTIDNLEKEMKNLLDMFLTKDPSSSDDVDGTIDITAASAAATTPACPRSPTTTTTNTSSPVTCSSQTTISIPPRTPSPTPTITSTTTVTPPLSPRSPTLTITSATTASPPQSPRSPTLTITSTTTASPPLSPRSLTLTISSTTTASPPLTPRSPTSTVSTITPLTPRSPASIATTPLTPRSPTTPTTTPTTRTPLFPSSENLVFTYPSSPTSLSSFTFPSPEPTATLQRRAKSLSTHHISAHSPSFSPSYHVLSPPPSSPSERKEEHQHFFSTIKEGMRNFGRRNSLRKKKKKKRPEIGEPQDFRTLTSTTSIKPDADPWSKAVEK